MQFGGGGSSFGFRVVDPDNERPEFPDTEPTVDPDGLDRTDRQEPLLPEKLIGPYHIEEEIGRGGMGVVYKAFHPQLKRTVALKVLIAGEDASDEAIARFHREAEAIAKIGHHQGIVPIYEIGQVERESGAGALREAPLHYIAMHFVEGTSLDRAIDEGNITPGKAALITRKIADALAHAHERGVLHRDIKPANILLAKRRDETGSSSDSGEGEEAPSGTESEGPDAPRPSSTPRRERSSGGFELGFEPMLTDFGLAKDVACESKMTRSGATLGTPQYMPPEQADGRLENIDARSDVYALGATLYEMLTLSPPFDGTAMVKIIFEILTREPLLPRRKNPAVDRDLEVICMKCLEKKPENRYASASALAEDLDRYLNRESILAKPPSPGDKLLRWMRRQRTPLLAATVAFVLAGAVAIPLAPVLLGGKSGPDEAELEAQEMGRKVAAQKRDEGRTILERVKKAFLVDDPKGLRDELDRAHAAFEAACEADPKNAQAFAEKGRILFYLRRLDQALEAFDRAIEINPGLTDPYVGRVQIKYINVLMARFLAGVAASKPLQEEIQADFDKIAQIGVQPHLEHWGKALMIALEGDVDKSRLEIEKALEVEKTYDNGYSFRAGLNLLQAFGKRRDEKPELVKKALADYTKALMLSGENPMYRIGRIDCLQMLNRHEEALEACEKLVATWHDLPQSYLLRAQARRALGDMVGYRADMERAETMDYESPESHLVAIIIVLGGMQSNRIGMVSPIEIRHALRHVEVLLEKHPDRTDIAGIHGLLLMLNGKPKEAMVRYERHLECNPDSGMNKMIRGVMPFLKAGLDLSQSAPAISYYIATQRLKDDRDAEALEIFQMTAGRFEKVGDYTKGKQAFFLVPMYQDTHRKIAALLCKGESGDPPSRQRLLEALGHLDLAVEAGFRGLKIFDKHPDYAPLRELPEYEERRAEWEKAKKK
jgi:serine/threonine protein kinase/predicted Zn-dependent protease